MYLFQTVINNSYYPRPSFNKHMLPKLLAEHYGETIEISQEKYEFYHDDYVLFRKMIKSIKTKEDLRYSKENLLAKLLTKSNPPLIHGSKGTELLTLLLQKIQSLLPIPELKEYLNEAELLIDPFSSGVNILYYAASSNNFSLFSLLINTLKDAGLRQINTCVLYSAAKSGNEQIFKLALQSCASPTAACMLEFSSRRTVLFAGIESNNPKIVKLILDILGNEAASHQLLQYDRSGITPAELALRSGNEQIANQVFSTLKGKTKELPPIALFEAVCSNKPALVSATIKAIGEEKALEACRDTYEDHYDDSLLHIAARLGNVDIIKLLLEVLQNENPKACIKLNKYQRTVLHEAQLSLNQQAVDLIAKALGDDLEKAQDMTDVTGIKGSGAFNADFLLRKENLDKFLNIIINATMHNRDKLVKKNYNLGLNLLINHLINHNIPYLLQLNKQLSDADRPTLLHLATRYGNYEAVKLILAATDDKLSLCAQPAKASKRTPLHDAISLGHEELTRLLLNTLKEGAPKTCMALDDSQHTALHIAVHSRNKTVISLVLECLGEQALEACQALSSQKHTPIQLAILAGDINIIKLLLPYYQKCQFANIPKEKILENAEYSQNLKTLELVRKEWPDPVLEQRNEDESSLTAQLTNLHLNM